MEIYNRAIILLLSDVRIVMDSIEKIYLDEKKREKNQIDEYYYYSEIISKHYFLPRDFTETINIFPIEIYY